jgi:hypothetical protein
MARAGAAGGHARKESGILQLAHFKLELFGGGRRMVKALVLFAAA